MNKLLKNVIDFRGHRSVIPRSACHYQCISLHNIPMAERMAVLQLQAKQWAPFATSRFNLVLNGGWAQLWCWNGSAPFSVSKTKVHSPVVETLFYSPPESGSGVRLLQCQEGIEGQVWQGRVLLTSHWWPQLPEPIHWMRFVRSAGISETITLPEPQQLKKLDRPWGKVTDIAARDFRQWERTAWKILPLIAAVLFGWQLGGLYQLKNASKDLEEEHAKRSQQLETMLQQRSRFDDSMARIKLLREFWNAPMQLELLQTIVTQMPSSATKILEWDFSQKHLSFFLQGEGVDPTTLVKAYSLPVWSHDVRVEKGRQANSMKVSMDIVPDRQKKTGEGQNK